MLGRSIEDVFPVRFHSAVTVFGNSTEGLIRVLGEQKPKIVLA